MLSPSQPRRQGRAKGPLGSWKACSHLFGQNWSHDPHVSHPPQGGRLHLTLGPPGLEGGRQSGGWEHGACLPLAFIVKEQIPDDLPEPRLLAGWGRARKAK